MKLYLVSRTDRWGYEDWDEFVCIAESKEAAKELHPSQCASAEDWKAVEAYSSHGWVSYAERDQYLSVTYLGEAADFLGSEKYVISRSFNAG